MKFFLPSLSLGSEHVSVPGEGCASGFPTGQDLQEGGVLGSVLASGSLRPELRASACLLSQ